MNTLKTITALIIALTLISCGSNENKHHIVTAAYVPAGYYLPFVVMEHEKLLEKRGYQLELRRFDSNSMMISSFINGQLDVTAQSALTMFPVEAQNKGYFKFIYAQYNLSYSFVVHKDSGIDSLSDLSGKRIGTWTSPTAEACIKIRLNHLPEESYQIIPFGASMVAAQLQNSSVDAVFLFDIFAENLIKEGNYKYLDKSSMEFAIKSPTGIKVFNGGGFINSRLIGENPKKAIAIREALVEALKIIKNEPKKAKTILANKLGSPIPSALDAVYDDFHLPNNDTITSAKATLDLLEHYGLMNSSHNIEVEKLFWIQ